MGTYVTMMSSDVLNQLTVAKTYLEDKGIPCFFKDELLNQVYAVGVGGVKLQVHEDDAIRAAEYLIEGGFAKKEDFEIPEYTLWMVRIYEKISDFFRRKK